VLPFIRLRCMLSYACMWVWAVRWQQLDYVFMCLRVGTLKWGMEHKGCLVSVDAYMNLQVTQFVWQQPPVLSCLHRTCSAVCGWHFKATGPGRRDDA
jgi:hypothetical protein